jgi:hypothetical protein
MVACVFAAPDEDRLLRVDEERPNGIALILRAIDLTIAEVEPRDTRDRDEQLATLRFMRERWSEKAEEEGDGA